MATVTPLSPSTSGSTFSPASASAGGDKVTNPRGSILIYVKNASGGSINVTLAKQIATRPAEGPYPSMAVSDIVVAVGAGVEKIIGPVPAAYNDGNGDVNIAYSSATSVTVAAIQPA